MKLRYVDFLAAGVLVAYAASMTLGIVPHGPARVVVKADCDSYLYPYDKLPTACRALRQDRGWPFVTNQVYSAAMPLHGGVYPKAEFVSPHCSKRCGDVMSWNGLLVAGIIMMPAGIFTYRNRG